MRSFISVVGVRREFRSFLRLFNTPGIEYGKYYDMFGFVDKDNIETTVYHLFGIIHRRHEDDLPARINEYEIQWIQYDGEHRENDLPAIIQHDGTMVWWVNGHRYRNDNKPTIEYGNGNKEWHTRVSEYGYDSFMLYNGCKIWTRQGILHRDGDKPAKIYPDRTKKWCKNGKKT
jgi:hypothetical protein